MNIRHCSMSLLDRFRGFVVNCTIRSIFSTHHCIKVELEHLHILIDNCSTFLNNKEHVFGFKSNKKTVNDLWRRLFCCLLQIKVFRSYFDRSRDRVQLNSILLSIEWLAGWLGCQPWMLLNWNLGYDCFSIQKMYEIYLNLLLQQKCFFFLDILYKKILSADLALW